MVDGGLEIEVPLHLVEVCVDVPGSLTVLPYTFVGVTLQDGQSLHLVCRQIVHVQVRQIERSLEYWASSNVRPLEFFRRFITLEGIQPFKKL